MQAWDRMGSDFTLPTTQDFWEYLDRLVRRSKLVIDRPRGAHHPRYIELIYPLDYGYLEGTTAADGEGIDVWIGSRQPRSLEAAILTVDLAKRETEVKLLLGCTQAEEQVALAFLNDGAMRAILVTRRPRWEDFLVSRRSVRWFNNQPVDDQVLERVLLAATWAPSAHNSQPWRFAILSSTDSRNRLAAAMGAEFHRDLLADGIAHAEADAQVSRSQRRILQAPVVILLCLDTTSGDSYPDERRQQLETLMAVQGVAMAGENLLLAAHAEGLGGVWVCAPLFAQQTVMRALGLPESWLPQGMIFLGYPARPSRPRGRHALEAIRRYF